VDFRLGPGGQRTIFDVAKILGAATTFNVQNSTSGPCPLTSTPKPACVMPMATRIQALQIIPGAVSQVAFGQYTSPNYLTPDYSLPSVSSYSGVPAVQRSETMAVVVFMPAATLQRPKPAEGWPVVLFGHGSGDTLMGGPFNVAAQMAAHGLATICIHLEGNGFGPLSSATVTTDQGAVTFPVPGRSADIDNNGAIGVTEGRLATAPRTILLGRQSLQQSAIDLMHLVREIQAGVDVDGDGNLDLDASRIYYAGWSAGAGVGVLFFPVEPAVRAAALVAVGERPSPWLSPSSRGAVAQFLTNRVPPLINP